MNFRHQLKRQGLARPIFEEIGAWRSETAVLVKGGTLMDATVIGAPSSNQNKACELDFLISQIRKMQNEKITSDRSWQLSSKQKQQVVRQEYLKAV